MKNNIINKKVKINKLLASFLIFFSFLILSHLLISSFRVINHEQNKFFSTLNNTKNYVKKHENEIKEEVFNKLFKKSERCNLIDNSGLRKNCFQNISHTLALIIKEEEFSYWPSDIFFVKKIGSNFLKLGWNGELTTLLITPNIKLLNNKDSSFTDFLLHQCNYFGTANYPSKSCEVFISINLDNHEKGYLVRKIPLLDNDYFIYYFLSPFLIFLGIITSFSLPNDFFYYKELFLGFIPFIIGFFIYFFLTKFTKFIINNKV